MSGGCDRRARGVRVIAACVVAGWLGGCGNRGERHDHGEAHPAGHDHHEEGHGHGGEPVVSATLWSDRFELFAEYPPGVVGRESAFLIHLTALDGFRPLERATVTVELDGPAALRGEASEPARPGIFRVAVTPRASGRYEGRVRVRMRGDGESKSEAGAEGVIEGLVFPVSASEGEADAHDDKDHDHDHGHEHAGADDHGHEHAGADDHEHGHEHAGADDHEHGHEHAGADDHEHADETVEFLKEQQWAVPFATAFAETGSIVPSVEVAGRIDTPPGGSAEVSAPVTGRVVAPAAGLPRPGDAVRKGRLLALLSPAPSSPEGAARANLAVAEAEARAAAARAALERAERLIRDDAIPRRQLEDAQREARVADESVRAAKRAAALYAGAAGAGAAGAWRLTAPIAGVLVAVRATPGATASPGDALFRIVDARELWIVAHVPEQDAARLRADRDAAFQLAGLDSWTAIDVTGDDANASVVAIGRTVDPVSRTVEVIYALRDPAPSLRVGGLVRVELPVATAGDDGGETAGVVVPRGAVLDQDGRELVYVQVDGEHFAERAVRTGARSGERVVIASGLRAGERVVTRGAHLIRLADRAASAPAHGHIH